MNVEGQLLVVQKHYKQTSKQNKGKWRRRTFKDMAQALSLAKRNAETDAEDQLICLVITEVDKNGFYSLPNHNSKIDDDDYSALILEREESQEIISELEDELKRLKSGVDDTPKCQCPSDGISGLCPIHGSYPYRRT